MRITKAIGISVSILCLLVVANLIILIPSARTLFQQAKEREEAKPPRFSVITVTAENCSDCFDPTTFVDALKKQNVAISEVRALNESDTEAQTLIQTYAPERLPMLLLKGAFAKNEELKKQLETIGTVTNDVFLWTQMQPLYKERATGAIRGRFSVTFLTDTTCKECYDVMRHQKAMANVGLVTSDDRVIDIRSKDGRALQKQYAITAVPTVLLTGDLDVYDGLKKLWEGIGTIEKDGAYVFRENGILAANMGTYRNMKTGKIIRQDTAAVPSVK